MWKYPQMATFVMLMVLTAAALHAGWNLAVKTRTDKVGAAALVAIGSAVAGIPLLLVSAAPTAESVPYIVVSGIVHAVYFSLLGLAYRHTDVSVAYPISRGSAPFVTSIGAALWLGEWLAPPAAIGIVLLSIGVLWLAVDSIRKGRVNLVGIAFALLNGFVIASYSLIDGIGGRLSGDVLSYNGWNAISTAAFLLPLVLLRRGTKLIGDIQAGWKFGLAGGAMSLTSYSIVVWAMTQGTIATAVALRETSIIFAAVFATLFLQERFSRSRYIATSIVALGVIAMRAA